MNTEPAMFQRICAPPDAEGNPRRLHAIYGTDASLLTCIDDEHFGRPKWFDDLIELPAVAVSVAEYNRWLRKAEPAPICPSWRERRRQKAESSAESNRRPTLAGR